VSHGPAGRSGDPNPFDDYRSAGDPMVRLFGTYGWADIGLFVVGVVASVLARGVALVPPLVLGVAIDAVFNSDAPFGLPLVPAGWLPATTVGQLWLSAG
jgi:ATP-binding cassette subfamily B protein